MHTHLFPGAEVEIDGLASTAKQLNELPPVGLRIAFFDGSEADAEVYVDTDINDAALVVESYTTMAGTPLQRKGWRISSMRTDDGVVTLRLGIKLPVL